MKVNSYRAEITDHLCREADDDGAAAAVSERMRASIAPEIHSAAATNRER